jgi:hypothetical protein
LWVSSGRSAVPGRQRELVLAAETAVALVYVEGFETFKRARRKRNRAYTREALCRHDPGRVAFASARELPLDADVPLGERNVAPAQAAQLA